MRLSLPLALFVPLVGLSACDAAEPPDGPTGGKADKVSEPAKGYAGRDFYDIDRFDDDNVGRACGFERARRGSVGPETRSISLNSVTFPLSTIHSTDDRPIKLERVEGDRSLFEQPVLEAFIESDPRNLVVTVFLNRLTLEPDVMLVNHDGGRPQLCQGLTPFE